MVENVPLKRVLELQQEGKNNSEVIQGLQREGYNFQQISEALNQALAKESVTPPPSAAPAKAAPGQQGLHPSLLNAESSSPAPFGDAPPAPSPNTQQSNFDPPQQPAWLAPAPAQVSVERFGSSSEDVEELAEAIIDEKWQKVMEDFGDIGLWKEKTGTDIESVKQELLRLENRFENLQKGVIGKMKDYDSSVSTVGIEMKALEKLLQNIISPLTKNVKELERITERLKK